MSAGIQLSLQVTKRISVSLKPLLLIQHKSVRSLSVTEQRKVTGTFLKDIRSFHDFQNHLHKKHMDINVVLSLICLCEYELLKKCGLIFNRALSCNVLVAPNAVFRLV